VSTRLPGDLVTVDGDQLHVVAEGTGTPVLLSAGLGGAWFDWIPVMELLRRRHRVIAFDRPGLGGSPPSPGHRTLRREADLLAALARWAGGPVIVVAHSLAGLHAEAFARLCPERVRGLVLVDPSVEPRRSPFARTLTRLTPLAHLTGAVADLTCVTRLAGPRIRGVVMRRICERGDVAPPEYVRAFFSRPTHACFSRPIHSGRPPGCARGHVLGALIAEELEYRQIAADLLTLRNHRPFPAVPLRVITALGRVRLPDDWRQAHAALAAMSPRGRQVVLPGVGHMVQIDRPEAIAEAVTEL
jgi:pimeloyl-ACP methyl ester carboxylesterase